MEETKNTKQSKKDIIYELIRFFIVSVFATLADYVTYFALRKILPDRAIGVVIATASGFLVGLVINYLLSVIFVYKQVKNKESTRTIKAFLLFSLIGLLGLAITEIGMLLEHEFLPVVTITLFSYTFDIIELAAKCIMTLLVAIWNYVGRKLFIFKS